MNTYYKVETKVYDNGYTSIEYKGVVLSEISLNDTCVEGSRYDLYLDYFGTEKEARDFIRENRE